MSGELRIYTTTIPAIDRLSLRLEAGESLAVFGPNGAGKTTLIRILTLGLRASDGAFRIGGLDPRRDDLEILSEPRPLPFDAAGNLGELGDEG